MLLLASAACCVRAYHEISLSGVVVVVAEVAVVVAVVAVVVVAVIVEVLVSCAACCTFFARSRACASERQSALEQHRGQVWHFVCKLGPLSSVLHTRHCLAGVQRFFLFIVALLLLRGVTEEMIFDLFRLGFVVRRLVESVDGRTFGDAVGG
jgi:hypothetical protein